MSDVINRAKEKLSNELKNFQGGQKEKSVSAYVEKTLKDFCEEEVFAKAVAESKNTLSDCCKEIMSKCGNYISDFEVYRKAAQFYFPEAKVDFTMSIKTNSVAAVVADQNAITEGEKNDMAKKQLTKKKDNAKKNPLDDTIQISLFGV